MRQASDRLYSVYCSAATREMLLCLERYPCRINYANGVLEARVQRYRHLKKLLVGGPLLLLVAYTLTSTLFRSPSPWKPRRSSSSSLVTKSKSLCSMPTTAPAPSCFVSAQLARPGLNAHSPGDPSRKYSRAKAKLFSTLETSGASRGS